MAQQDSFPSRLKDPGAHEDFSVDWTDYLAPDNDGIVSMSCTISPQLGDPHLKVLAPNMGQATGISQDSKKTFVWLAGGVVGRSYVVTHQAVTVNGRTAEQSFRINIRKL